MTNAKTTMLGRLRGMASEINHAQARLTEIRTGVPMTTRPKRSRRHGA